MPLNPAQLRVAGQIYTLAKKAGLPDNRAKELVAASYAESGLNPNAVNKSSGAAGLFQLLSSGYREKAEQLGGLNDVAANTGAILPNYVSYWREHPNAAPGEAARDVEASGEGADFYSGPLKLVGGVTPVGVNASRAPAVAPAAPRMNPLGAMTSTPIPTFQAPSFDAPSFHDPILDSIISGRGMPSISEMLEMPSVQTPSFQQPDLVPNLTMTSPVVTSPVASTGDVTTLPDKGGATGATTMPYDPKKNKGAYKFLSVQPDSTLSGVNTRLLDSVNKLGQHLGVKITVNSGYRDQKEQAALYKRYIDSGRDPRYIAAAPGTSNHERGEALDLSINGVPIAKAVPADVLRKYGLHNPVSGDLPHTTLLNING